MSSRHPVRLDRRNAAGLALFVSMVMITGCRPDAVDTQELLTAQSSGVSFLQRGQLADAERMFKRVIELAPKDPIGHANLGLTYLRNGQFGEAESELLRARRIDPRNADVAMMLARLYAATGRGPKAQALLLEMGDDPRALFARAELQAMLGASGDTASMRLREELLSRLLGLQPANVAVRVRLAEVQLALGMTDSAAAHLRDVRRLRPEPAPEPRALLDSTLQALRGDDASGARTRFHAFHEAMKLTTPYQSTLDEVKWVEGPLVGRPILTFKPQTLISTRGLLPAARQAQARFTDVTGEAGLGVRGAVPTAIALGDYDGDGTDNLLLALDSAGGRGPGVHLYNLQGGYVVDVTSRSGIAIGGARDAVFADFDNDGWLDLFVLGLDGRAYLLHNTREGRLVDASATARVTDTGGATRVVVADLDHDGDLDLFLIGGSANHLYRNNLDGSFSDVTAAMGVGGTARDAAIGDFDDDGRIDLVVATGDGMALYRNSTLQRFERVMDVAAPGASRLAVGDYDNDGQLDVAVAGQRLTLWRNVGGRLAADARAARATQAVARPANVRFVDVDNDGWLDLAVAGARATLLRNAQEGRFAPTSALPPLASAGSALLAASDVDGDGDEDLFLSDTGGIHQLRNDGGNARLAMQIQLVGMRAGGGKNNNFGIGSKIEVRAGELYQTRVVTDRVTHFGLGPHLKADVLRVQWTNGVPQTIYFPGTDQDVLELETLKGSCGFLYTWDGTRFRFVTDVMWRSALGMPLGLMGASGAAYAPAGASQEYLRIPGALMRPRDGRYVLQFTEELWETAYLDDIRLIAVDHPDSVELFVDERFVPPGPVQLRIVQAAHRHAPLSAVDNRGRDVLAELRDQDDVYLSGLVPLHYQGLVEPYALVMDLGPDAGRAGSSLFLRGWIFPTDASINVALGQQSALQAQPAVLEVRDSTGAWRVLETLGFPSGKDKTIVVDLAGRFPTSDHHVRLRTNMRIHWDQVFVASDAGAPVRTTTLEPQSADLHFRGYSRMYRKGVNGPQWFDYASVTTASPWRTITGAFTRFGDVLPLLGKPDDMYVIMAPGDEATVQFDAALAPPPGPGWKRTFFLYTDGWIKDSDLNTAYGTSVEPLPFHAARAYPYAPGEAYPADSAHARYRRDYNTRVVTRASASR